MGKVKKFNRNMKSHQLTEQEKLDKEFRKTLYSIDNLSSEDYALADVIKDYVDKKIELILKERSYERK